MTKQTFLAALAEALHSLPKNERRDILRDYEEYFVDAEQAGRSEAEVIEMLGEPKTIADQLITNRKQDWTRVNLSFPEFIRATIAIISLAFFNIMFIFAPFTLLTTVVVSIWSVCITMALAPLIFTIIVFFNIPISPQGNVYLFMQAYEFPAAIQQSFLQISGFMSVMLCGIGILGCIILYYISRWLIRMFMKYINTNTSIVRGSIKS
jgi:uncharacterized membrane protein